MNNSEKPVVKKNFTPQPEVEVWIARDRGRSLPQKYLYMYLDKPQRMDSPGGGIIYKNSDRGCCAFSLDAFPSIKPGECKRAKIVLEEE